MGEKNALSIWEKNETDGIHVEKTEMGIILCPFVEESTWAAVYVEEREEDLLVIMDDDKRSKGIYEILLEDGLKDEYSWNLPKEVLSLCEEDTRVIFKIVELLDILKVEPEKLMRVLMVLKEYYALESVMQQLANSTVKRAKRLFNETTLESAELIRMQYAKVFLASKVDDFN